MIQATQLHEEHGPGSTTFRAPTSRAAIWVPLIAVLLLALGLVYGIWHHVQMVRDQEAFAKKTAQTSVDYLVVHRAVKSQDLLLPGNITAAQETQLYPRAAGYVTRWLVDLGDVVKPGQILAEIATPEIDQQLQQARQELNQAEANFELARVSAQRWRELVEKKVVSKQENDEKQSAYAAASSAVNAAKANVARLEETQAFKNVVAPFGGRITSRKIDVGSLVSAGSGTAGTPLFSLAQTDPLDIYVNVPQNNVPAIQEGMPVDLLVPEYAGQPFHGLVIRTAGALDPTSRTLLTEVEIPNKEGKLFPGMYAQVKFSLKNPRGPILIPANAFSFGVEGPRVATVSADGKIHWQTIQVGRDFGKEVEATFGLRDGDRAVLNPTDDLKEGLVVEAKMGEADGEANAHPE